MIDFVRDELDAKPIARRADIRERIAGQHGAGGVGRAHKKHAIEPLLPMLRLDHLRSHGKPGCCRDRQWHRD